MPIRHVISVLFVLLPLLSLPGTARADAYDNAMLVYESGNYTEAMALWKLLATQGHAQAQYNLGFMYEFGYGTEPNEHEAFKWYLRAAEREHVQAMHNVAWMYKLGKGTAQNKIEAVKWAQLATASRVVEESAIPESANAQPRFGHAYAANLLEVLGTEFGLAAGRYEFQKTAPPPQPRELEASNQTS